VLTNRPVHAANNTGRLRCDNDDSREVAQLFHLEGKLTLGGVQKILADRFQGSAQRTAKERRIGRRFYHSGSVRVRRAAHR
jgi:hypothetical protein